MAEVDNIVKNSDNITDLKMIYLREKINKMKNQEAYIELEKYKGAGKKKIPTTDEDIHKNRAQVLERMNKEREWD